MTLIESIFDRLCSAYIPVAAGKVLFIVGVAQLVVSLLLVMLCTWWRNSDVVVGMGTIRDMRPPNAGLVQCAGLHNRTLGNGIAMSKCVSLPRY
jgi:hypothetical protein